jgi:hypothetical protein
LKPQNKNKNILGKYFKNFAKQDHKIIPKTLITILAPIFQSCGYRAHREKYGRNVIISTVVIRSLTKKQKTERNVTFLYTAVGYVMPVPLVARSKAWVCGGSLVG